MASPGTIGGNNGPASGFNEFSLQAKVIVLGDPKVGKSSLIHNLDPAVRGGYRGSSSASDGGVGTDADIIFSVVEFPVAELIGAPQLTENSSSSSNSRTGKGKQSTPVKTTGPGVFLKIWEYNTSISKEEEELAFRGALFCVVVLDLRLPESARSVFSKWIAMKEKSMNECFLFVVGTHLDQVTQRRVDIAEICKACAQKEAIYTEVSNFDGTNMALLRRLMAQRINYVLNVRETMNKAIMGEIESEKKGSESPVNFLRGGSLTEQELDIEFSEEAKMNQEHDRVIQSTDGPLNAPFLEQDLCCDSIGSILASAMGTEFWPGYEMEEEHLTQIANTLSGFVDKLTTESKSLPKAPIDVSLMLNHESIWEKGGGVEGTSMYDIPEPDYDNLRHVFEVMGFALPQTFNSIAESYSGNSSPSKGAGSSVPVDASGMPSPDRQHQQSARSQQSKLKVRLPDGSMSVLIIYPGYEVADQVDAFLVQYGMDEDRAAREKLIEAANKMRAATTAAASSGAVTTPSLLSPLKPTAAESGTAATTEQKKVLSPSSLPLTPQPSVRKSMAVESPSALGDAADGTPLRKSSVIDAGVRSSPAAEGVANVTAKPQVSGSAVAGSAAKSAPRTPLMVPPPPPRSQQPAAGSARKDSVNAAAGTPVSSSAAKPQSKKCKIRIQLPDFAGGAIETVVREGQDLGEVARAIAVEHNLSWGYQQKVYDQLRAAFKK
jgi:hypothetical protein